MKLLQRLLFLFLFNLVLGAIFVPPDFSSSVSASHLIFNWLERLLIATGFAAVSLLISRGIEGDAAESYRLIDRGYLSPDPGPTFDEHVSFEQTAPSKSLSEPWSPKTYLLAGAGVMLVAEELHWGCEMALILIAVFLWMPNPWQGSANQPETYEIVPRRDSR
jgi:hypothetical protein